MAAFDDWDEEAEDGLTWPDQGEEAEEQEAEEQEAEEPEAEEQEAEEWEEAVEQEAEWPEAEEQEADEQESAEKDSFQHRIHQLSPPAKFDAALREAMAAVDRTVRQTFGATARVQPYGSIVQGAQLQGSDLDLAVDLPDVNLDAMKNGKSDNTQQVKALQRIMHKLSNEFWVIETRFFKHIKVPILILGYSGPSGEEVETDISVGVEYEGVEKGHTDRLVRRILARAPRALHMVRVIKIWAKTEGLNKAFDGFLNALGWTLLVLFFFISRGEATTEMLEDEEENERGPGGDGSVPPPLSVSNDASSEEVDLTDIPSGEDVAEFFDMVAEFEDWPPDPEEGTQFIISLVDGAMAPVPKTGGKQWSDTCDFFLEDPGPRVATGRSENVARALRKGTWQTTLRKCREAATALRADGEESANSWLRELLQKADAAKSAGAAAAAKANAAKKRPWPGQGGANDAQQNAKRARTAPQAQPQWAAAVRTAPKAQPQWAAAAWQMQQMQAAWAAQQAWNNVMNKKQAGRGWAWKK